MSKLDIKNAIQRITIVLANRAKIEDIIKDKGPFVDPVYLEHNGHSLVFEPWRLSCRNCGLFPLDRIDVSGITFPVLTKLHDASSYLSGITPYSLLDFIASKYVLTYSTGGSEPYPIGTADNIQNPWSVNSRWRYIEFVRTELEYFLSAGHVKDMDK